MNERPRTPTTALSAEWQTLFSRHGRQNLLREADSVAEVADRCRGRLCYLATPFTKLVTDCWGDFSPMAALAADRQAGEWAARLALAGVTAISPINASVAMLETAAGKRIDPLSDSFWQAWCAPLLNACGAVVIPPIPGWAQSNGVLHEATTALRGNVPVFILRPAEREGAA